MPKIIANLEDTIIEQANIQLFEKGYSDMTMRSVAEACGIAVGTVYNYYSSKDMLVAKIMLRDWNSIVADVEKACKGVRDIHEGFKTVYDGVLVFVEKYDPVWTQYGKGMSVRREMPYQYDMLISQLSGILSEVLVRCHGEKDDYISVFLAEVLLNTATKKDFEYDNISRVLHRMFD